VVRDTVSWRCISHDSLGPLIGEIEGRQTNRKSASPDP
jgi:hypothetical protein